MVCSHTTGHAETTRVTYDPKQITYEQLLEEFFESHDPTQLDRQGPDIGDSYRSAVFYHNKGQKKVIQKVVEELNKGRFNGRIVTQIAPAKEFFRAEEYHQQYHAKQQQV